MPSQDLWQNILTEVEKRIRRQQFETWFRCIKPLELTDARLVLGVPNRFYRDWLEAYYTPVVKESAAAVSGQSPAPEVVFEVSEGAGQALQGDGDDRGDRGQSDGGGRGNFGADVWNDDEPLFRAASEQSERSDGGDRGGGGDRGRRRADDAAAPREDGGTGARERQSGAASARGHGREAPPARQAEISGSYPQFSPQYTFENFIVGPSNRLCHAAAIAVVDAPGKAYNPLFIHGGVGLGKTHLLQAACRTFLAKNPAAKIVYTSCEEFVNDFVSAVQHGDVAAFRKTLREVDFMVIDDIHFLARAERTQEEFFHTFNSLYNAHKQIILSSDCAPSEIPTIEERLVSRFKWGLVARLEPPAFETRLAIIKKKAEMRGLVMPADAADFIARSIDSNIRELEGALTRVIGYAALSNRSLTLDLAREALRDIVVFKPQVSIEEIAKVVAGRFNLKLSDLQGKRRLKSIAMPRQICMYVARQLTEYSLEEIGGFFGGRDHTTVMYADDKIATLMKDDPRTRAIVNDIRAELTRPSR